MYDELMGWVGTLEFLKPNQGYKYKYSPQATAPDTQQLYYPKMGSMLKSSGSSGGDQSSSTISEWSSYKYNMSLVAKIEGIDQDAQDQLYAYAGGELRGKASPIRLKNEQYLYFITLHGSQDQASLSFSYNHKDQTYPLEETMQFKPTTVKGSVKDPFVFDLTGKGETHIPDEVTCDVFPNPAREKFTVSIKQRANKPVEIRLINTLGKTVKARSGLRGKTIVARIHVSDLESGVYFVEVKTGDKDFHQSLIIK
jgi:hypothetical protein